MSPSMQATWRGEACQLKLRQYAIAALHAKEKAVYACKGIVEEAENLRREMNDDIGWKFWRASSQLDAQHDADHAITLAKIKLSARQREVDVLKEILFLISMVPFDLTLSHDQISLIYEAVR